MDPKSQRCLLSRGSTLLWYLGRELFLIGRCVAQSRVRRCPRPSSRFFPLLTPRAVSPPPPLSGTPRLVVQPTSVHDAAAVASLARASRRALARKAQHPSSDPDAPRPDRPTSADVRTEALLSPDQQAPALARRSHPWRHGRGHNNARRRFELSSGHDESCRVHLLSRCDHLRPCLVHQ